MERMAPRSGGRRAEGISRLKRTTAADREADPMRRAQALGTPADWCCGPAHNRCLSDRDRLWGGRIKVMGFTALAGYLKTDASKSADKPVET
jgi:hypothetical protein